MERGQALERAQPALQRRHRAAFHLCMKPLELCVYNERACMQVRGKVIERGTERAKIDHCQCQIGQAEFADEQLSSVCPLCPCPCLSRLFCRSLSLSVSFSLVSPSLCLCLCQRFCPAILPCRSNLQNANLRAATDKGTKSKLNLSTPQRQSSLWVQRVPKVAEARLPAEPDVTST